MPNAKPDGRTVILLVDDDPGDQELTRRALSEIDVDLRMVADGEEAIEYLTHEGLFGDPASAPRPDLILLDLNMPRMNGREVLARIRESADLAHIPVVVLTTSQQESDILRSYDLGCNSYIQKPVRMNEFVDVVRDLGKYWFDIVSLPTT